MKLAIFNVKFSENIGDGLLATCLENQIRDFLPSVELQTFDLAGRVNYGETNKYRHLLLRVLAHLPNNIRQRVVRYLVASKVRTLKAKWYDEISNADAVIIGGGNLFQDDDLNFPTKIAAVIDAVLYYKKPLAIYAVGVTANWSTQAQALFDAIKNVDLVHCSVRDKLAQTAWKNHFPDSQDALILPDPALSVSWPTTQKKKISSSKTRTYRPIIGLCITDPLILVRHSSDPLSTNVFQSVSNYISLIAGLVKRGYRIYLFCNGAREDYKLLEKIANTGVISDLINSSNVNVTNRPKNPFDLLEIIAIADVVIAHRLHACIAAHALDIPTFGLGWDNKVEAFFDFSERRKYFIESKASSKEIISKVDRLLKEGCDHEVRPHLKNKSIAGIKKLIDDLKS
ncbi:polysaccharide pyruvyl transferase family protein [Ahrensia sp. 13_GOM-1096m]|uniref:polysaccharide pyruvyl transferase family protein n=1 Tax=Ahrensia sp. 13_GOM-1096m TaxID=1380380 RepID=UPI00047E6C0E|nr:polysaccharide pyruvyl transferase family protein [Ahrensia sp. 13_GOM-1096m]